MAESDRRLIETAFPLKQASLDSVHEKNVRHGHISTLHIWPARRPLAASRAALLATLLPAPDRPEDRNGLLQRIGGTVSKRQTSRGEKEATSGGVLHWGRESSADMDALRAAIPEAFDGRAPRVLDPFAGGGAIPLEAARLGCDVTASDLSPVAWFILRCALHYPKIVGDAARPLPAFALQDRQFVEGFLKANGASQRSQLRWHMDRLGHGDGKPVQTTAWTSRPEETASFAWHFRAWGRRLLAQTRAQLASRYPTYADFEPLQKKGRSRQHQRPVGDQGPPRLLEPDATGAVSATALNSEFDADYLSDERNPRWIAKPTVAYLWARTAQCANCRAEFPLLKTRWLCRRENKRVLLTMGRGGDHGFIFGIDPDVPSNGNDDDLGAGTMSQSGAECPICHSFSTMADLRSQGRSGRLGALMTAVVVDGQLGKEYRLPTAVERQAAQVDESVLTRLFEGLPFRRLNEQTPKSGVGASRAFSIDGYGIADWASLFSNRQLLALGEIVRNVRSTDAEMRRCGTADREPLICGLACTLDKLADYSSSVCSWHNGRETIGHTFVRFALPFVWDYCEVNPLAETTGGFLAMSDWVARYFDHAIKATEPAAAIAVKRESAIAVSGAEFDLVCTDPPYYDAIPYSDLMDFFHVWLRRVLHGLSPEIDAAFSEPLGPKWDARANDGELIDDASRFGGDQAASKHNYEDGMARAFQRFHAALRDDGRLVVVFANKQPDAWETLVSALIRAGFVVTASWPIQTEMQNRQRGLSSAALSSSIWLVCRKRPPSRPGWDTNVLAEMERNITRRLRDFWDAGIRGPDFVWAATGPALEAFSRYPAVRVTDSANTLLTVAEFLRRVRRTVVAFVVNRLLDAEGGLEDLDDLTTYYLLHRKDFGFSPAPSGACILYALSCNVSDADLAGRLDVVRRGGRRATEPADDGDAVPAAGNEVGLKRWDHRRAKNLGEASPDGTPPALIDRLHRLMRLWKAGDQGPVDRFLERNGLKHHDLFAHLVQAVLELAERGSEERSLLESIQNHLRGVAPSDRSTQTEMAIEPVLQPSPGS